MNAQASVFDRASTHAHIELIHSLANGIHGVIPLCVFGEDPSAPDVKIRKIESFEVGAVQAMTAAAMRFEQREHANVYAPLHIMRSDLPPGMRGKKDDIVAVLGLPVDFDGGAGAEGVEKMKARGLAPSYVIESSPGNSQAILIFDKPMLPADAELIAKALQLATNSDHGTGDIAHVWRAPGCLNWPNAKKVREGRPRQPAPVVMLQPDNGRRYTHEELRALLARELEQLASSKAKVETKADDAEASKVEGPSPIDGSSLPNWLFDIIRNGVPEGHRSEQFFRVVGALKDLGWQPQAIEDLLLRYRDGIAQKYSGRLKKEVERAFAKAEDRAQSEAKHDELIDELNKRYCVISDGGKTRVLSFATDSQKQHRRQVVTLMTFQDFRYLYSNKKCE